MLELEYPENINKIFQDNLEEETKQALSADFKAVKGLLFDTVFFAVSINNNTELEEFAKSMAKVCNKEKDSIIGKLTRGIGCIPITPLTPFDVNRKMVFLFITVKDTEHKRLYKEYGDARREGECPILFQDFKLKDQ